MKENPDKKPEKGNRLVAMALIERWCEKFYSERGKFCRHSPSYGEKFNEVQDKISSQ